jgi:hypothetical protein
MQRWVGALQKQAGAEENSLRSFFFLEFLSHLNFHLE